MLALGLAMAACGTLQRAAPYDPLIEKTVTEFNKAVLSHIAKMQGVSKLEKGTYGENVEFYTSWKVKLSLLRNHAIAREVGTSCGPEQISNDLIVGGFTALNDVLQKAQATVNSVKRDSLDKARKWANEKKDVLKANLTKAENTLNAATSAQGDLKRLEAKVGTLTEKYERWYIASNRVSAAIAALSRRDQSQPLEGGCTTRLVTSLAEQFAALERFHMKQEDRGIPPRTAPATLMSVPIQVILKVQQRKKSLSARGLL